MDVLFDFSAMLLKAFKWFAITLLMIALSFYVLFRPSLLSEVQFEGRSIRIDRDDFGIATMHVTTTKEMLYGLGTLYAEDRLFQISLRSYSAQGRLS